VEALGERLELLTNERDVTHFNRQFLGGSLIGRNRPLRAKNSTSHYKEKNIEQLTTELEN
jgi:hypothetical protein